MKISLTAYALLMAIIANSADIEIDGKIYKNYELEKIDDHYVNIVYDGGAKTFELYSNKLPKEIKEQLKMLDDKIDISNLDIEKERNACKQNCKELKELYYQLKNKDLLEFQTEEIKTKIKNLEQQCDSSYKKIEKYEKKQAIREEDERMNPQLHPKRLSPEKRLQRQKQAKTCL